MDLGYGLKKRREGWRCPFYFVYKINRLGCVCGFPPPAI
jgi:hypothetical protein